MVNYPNKKKNNHYTSMIEGKHNTAHRGMNLEEDINLTNEYYLSHDIAVIHKKPTPIQIVKVSYPERSSAKIVEAYFRTPSTTDYNGIYKGKYIDFEAKVTQNKTSFPLQNIHEHQISHMQKIMKHGGITFFIILMNNIVYLLKGEDFIFFVKNNQRKSIPYQYLLDNAYEIKYGINPELDYLKIVDKIYFRGDK